jgi:hypothetical protein
MDLKLPTKEATQLALDIQSIFLGMSHSNLLDTFPIVHWSSIMLKPQPLPNS